jgi:hypothetical protein
MTMSDSIYNRMGHVLKVVFSILIVGSLSIHSLEQVQAQSNSTPGTPSPAATPGESGAASNQTGESETTDSNQTEEPGTTATDRNKLPDSLPPQSFRIDRNETDQNIESR